MQPIPSGPADEPLSGEKTRLRVMGRVLTAEGGPAAGSHVLLVAYRSKAAEAIAGGDGRFTFDGVELPLARGDEVRGPGVDFRLVAFAADRPVRQ